MAKGKRHEKPFGNPDGEDDRPELHKMTPADFIPPDSEIGDEIDGPSVPIDGDALELNAETLTGDIRDSILAILRAMEVGWRFLPERDQRERIRWVEERSADLVRQVMGIVIAYDFPAVPVTLGKVTLDKSVDVRVSAENELPNVMALANHQHRRAVLVLVDPDEFKGERAPAKADPDQKDAFAEA